MYKIPMLKNNKIKPLKTVFISIIFAYSTKYPAMLI